MNSLRKLLLILFLTMTVVVFIGGGIASAEKIIKGAPACLTADLFDQLVTAMNKNDENALQYLMNNGCIVTNDTYSATVLDRTWTGTIKVRVYVKGDAVELFTFMEAVK